MTADTAATQAGYYSCNSRVWSRNGQEYSLCSWGGCLAALGAMQQVNMSDKVMT